jgi:hypothetical protein
MTPRNAEEGLTDTLAKFNEYITASLHGEIVGEASLRGQDGNRALGRFRHKRNLRRRKVRS